MTIQFLFREYGRGWPLFLITLGFLGIGCVSCSQPPETMLNEMVIVPAGWFLMGQDDDRKSNNPQRQVYLDAYAIDRTEVTNAAFSVFVAQTNFQTKRGWDNSIVAQGADEPVVGILWSEADAYCRWVGKRLPSEAEWEKAARGIDGWIYPWGNHWDPSKANTLESNLGGVVAVGSYPGGASIYGVLDMAGNAAEWVSDYFEFDYYTYAPSKNPTGADEVLDHGLRGGSWASDAAVAKTFFRDSSHSVRPNQRVGFRCAMTLPADNDK